MGKIVYIIRNTVSGAPTASQNVSIDTASGTPIDSILTDSDGLASISFDGSPGPVIGTAVLPSRTVKKDGRSRDQMGTWYTNDVPAVLRCSGNGVVPGYSDPQTAANDMAVSPGTGLQVQVATGLHLIDGHIYRCTSTKALAIGANASGQTRYDRVVVRFTREGQTDEGKCELAIKAGTPGAGDAPALTRSSSVMEYSLAKVRIINGASSIVSGDLTDERYAPALAQSYVYAAPNAFSAATTGYQAGDVLYVNANGKLSRLGKGTDGDFLRVVSGLPAWQAAALTIVVQEGDVTVDANVNTLDFNSTHFDVTSTPAGEANIIIADNAITQAELANGAVVAGKIANNAVTNSTVATGIDAVKLGAGTVSNTELGYLDGVTSAIQPQLNGKSATTHTHTMPPQLSDSAWNDYYTPINVTSAGQDICSVSLTLLNGVTYDCICDADLQGGAPPSGGTFLRAFALIDTGASTGGSKIGTVGGERWAGARQSKTIVGTGAPVTFKTRANTDGGTGVVNGAGVRATATPRNVPAS